MKSLLCGGKFQDTPKVCMSLASKSNEQDTFYVN